MMPCDYISIFDMLKIGVGPSSSHTLGPWRAAQAWMSSINRLELQSIEVYLYGSLSLTGKGHGTDMAVMLGLSGEDPVQIPVEQIPSKIQAIERTKKIDHIPLRIEFSLEFLPGHPNALRFLGYMKNGHIEEAIFYSTGGGFIVQEGELSAEQKITTEPVPYPVCYARDIVQHTTQHACSISELARRNEMIYHTPENIRQQLHAIWQVMFECMYQGTHTFGSLPGGLNVKRRAAGIYQRLLSVSNNHQENIADWMNTLCQQTPSFRDVFKWVSLFALAVNEVNASLGRVVTAPTNGSAGVIPAVLMYYLCFVAKAWDEEKIERFLLTSGLIGSIFKRNATISAAAGGCQAEIGVSSSMAAAALVELLGGTVEQSLAAAEIAMEHHLGMTCDPVGGLVQVPCIERNSMGAIKAIHAAELALESNPEEAIVSLDHVIEVMWATAQDMNQKYKETSLGGLAKTIPVNFVAC
jgi:L-serine dehydratase